MSFRAETTRGAQTGVASGTPTPPHDTSTLPLRLSVAQGTISVELTRPFALGGLVVDALEVLLDGVQFPVDLSRGVKQFRNRRGTLRRLEVRLDLDVLGDRLLAAAAETLGEPALGVRVVPAPLLDLPPGAARPEGLRSENDAPGPSPALGLLSICVFGAQRAVAFDLVLAPGSPPCFIVDEARGMSLEQPALATALGLLERGLSGAPFGFVRQGRTIRLSGLARALLAEVFPSLGFRSPRIGSQVVHRALFGPQGISLSMTDDEQPCPVGARAIRLAGLAAFTEQADDRLASLDLEGARSAYLDALERVPTHGEVLLNLAELDAHFPLRSESALAFLEEARPGGPLSGSRSGLIAGRALAQGLRGDLGLEAVERALESETDGIIAALCHCRVAASRADDEALAELDTAVSRAPAHPQPRWLRLELNLRAGTLAKALVDAQQLEAGAAPGEARAVVAARIGRLLAEQGHLREAVTWLRRALVAQPDEPLVLLDLAAALDASGEGLRAAEAYQTALVRAEAAPNDAGLNLDAARLSLGRLLASETGDLALALGYVKKVGSRSTSALDAREFELSLARRLGDVGALRSAALRLIQAVEVGWIADERARSVLQDVQTLLRERGQDDVADSAARVVRGIESRARI